MFGAAKLFFPFSRSSIRSLLSYPQNSRNNYLVFLEMSFFLNNNLANKLCFLQNQQKTNTTIVRELEPTLWFHKRLQTVDLVRQQLH